MSSDDVREVVDSEYAKALIRVKARQMCRQPGFTRSDAKDFEQELFLLLIAKLECFDPARASLNTFIDRVVESGVRMMLRNAARLKRGKGRFARSLDAEPASGHGRPQSTRLPQDAHSRRTGRQQRDPIADFLDSDAIAAAIESMSEDLREICEMLKEVEPTPLAKRMGMSRRQMNRSMEQIREHFIRAGLGKASDSRTPPE